MQLNSILSIRPFALLLACSAVCRADQIDAKGQAIFEKYQHSVVTVQVVLKCSYSKDGQALPPTESKYELTGTFVDPSGLIALAHSGCDPVEFYKGVTTAYDGYKVEAEIVDFTILLDDNTEVPAEIVLRDKDLDLAFARPKHPLPHPVKAVDFTNPGSAKVLDQVIALNRLNQVSGRAYSADVARVIAVVDKPRHFYLHNGGSSEGIKLGSPVFSLDGNILGLLLMRVGGPKGGNDGEGAVSIILPADQVLKSARQVPPVQKEAAKKETPDVAKDQK